MVLKEHEESKHRNHHDKEIDEDEEDENLGNSRSRSSINPFDLLNEGDEDPDSDKVSLLWYYQKFLNDSIVLDDLFRRHK